jgi:hypothetical protein
MTLDLDAIPYTDHPPDGAGSTRALSALAIPRRRRTVLKAMVYTGLTIGATALAVPFLGRTRPALAETSPGGGLEGWDDNDCTVSYPGGGYPERDDSHGIYMPPEQPACFGSTWIGWNWCNAAGWHRSGTNIPSAPPGWQWECRPISTACGRNAKKNAWRWTTPNGKIWRCSDGRSRVRRVGDACWSAEFLTICRARVG